MGSSVKVHQFPRGFWDHVQLQEPQTSFTVASSETSDKVAAAVCSKRIRQPLAPNMGSSNNEGSPRASFDLKSFIRPDSGPRRLSSSADENGCHKRDRSPIQVETHPGGTRWNPTQEQIGILEMLYKRGMRTPNAQQIEKITEKLSKYGKIEGKNVFYWFQNHKARERQRQKRQRLDQNHRSSHPTTIEINAIQCASNAITTMLTKNITEEAKLHHVEVTEGVYKRRCRSWTFDHSPDFGVDEESENNMMISNRPCHSDDEGTACRTLQLFPLHPETGRKEMS